MAWGRTSWSGGGRSFGTSKPTTKVVKPKPVYTSSQKATIKTGPAPTSSKTKTPGTTYSSYDKAYHPASWYAPKAKPVAKPTTTGDKGIKPVAKPVSQFGHKYTTPAAIAARKGGFLNPNARRIASKATNYGKGWATTSRTGGSSGGGRVPTKSGKPTNLTGPKPVPKQVAKKVAPKPVVKKIAPKLIVHKGRGKMAKFRTRRRGDAPRHGLSMTPEMLQAAARQRIVNYH